MNDSEKLELLKMIISEHFEMWRRKAREAETPVMRNHAATGLQAIADLKIEAIERLNPS
jgi:hypothetical protein